MPPGSRSGPITPAERTAVINASTTKGHYEQTIDRESAYEKLKARTEDRQATADTNDAAPAPSPAPRGGAAKTPAPAQTGSGNAISDMIFGSTGPRGGKREGMLESAMKSAARSVGSGLGRSIMRGMLGGILGGKR
jgi:hypothetical protein